MAGNTKLVPVGKWTNFSAHGQQIWVLVEGESAVRVTVSSEPPMGEFVDVKHKNVFEH